MLSASTLNVTKLRVSFNAVNRLALTCMEARDRLNAHHFQPIDNTVMERSFGWCAWNDITDIELKESAPEIGGGHLAFALRIDLRKIAPPLLKKEYAVALKEEAGKKFISRELKLEIKELVKMRLMARTLPTPKSIGVVWDTVNNAVYFLSTNDKEIELFKELFTKTFNLELEETEMDHERTAPSEFLAWLWFNAELTNGHIGEGLYIWNTSKITLSGSTASVSTVDSAEEAKLSLKLGKTISSMSVHMRDETKNIRCDCVLDGHISRLNGIKGIPFGRDAEDEDAAFLEQIYVLEKLFAYVDRAYDKHLETLQDCAMPLARWRCETTEAVQCFNPQSPHPPTDSAADG